MTNILKYAGIAFVLQLVLIGIAILFLEGFGIEFFWSFLLVLYISPADTDLRLLSGNPRGASGTVVFVAGLIPLILYSLAFGFAFTTVRKKGFER
jgi:hypothetical protein